jgi:hypothetical protein
MSRFTNSQIKEALTELRIALREGKTRVDLKQANALQNVVGASLRGLLREDTVVLDASLFSRAYMNPQTAYRFKKFFDEAPNASVNPDDTAWALQNFINRRADPWGFWYNKNEATATAITARFAMGAEESYT